VHFSFRDHRLSATPVVAGLLLIALSGLAIWVASVHRRAGIATEDLKKARAEVAHEREVAQLAAVKEQEERARAKLADSRRLAALSESERDKHPDRALLLAVEAFHREDSLEARGSLLDALLTRPEVTSFYHRARGPVLSVVYSPDGRTLAAGGFGGQQGGWVLLLDPSRSTETPLPVPEGGVTAVAFSRDGKILAAGIARRGRSGGVVLWDPELRARLRDQPLDVQDGPVSSVAFGPNGKTLAAGCSTGRVVLWDVSRRARITDEPMLANENYEVKNLAFSADGKTFIAVCGGQIELWDPAKRKRISVLSRAETESIECAAFSPDGKSLAAGAEADDDICAGVALWDMVGHRRLFELPLAVAAVRVTSVAFGPGNAFLAAGFDDTVVLWDLARRPPLAERPRTVAEASITSLAFSPDGTSLAAGYRRRVGGGAVIWEVEARSRLAPAPGHQ